MELIVEVTGATDEAALQAAEALRAELARRGVGGGEVRVEAAALGRVPAPGSARAPVAGSARAPVEALLLDGASGPLANAEAVLARLRPARLPDSVYSSEEEDEMRRRLEDLGYL